jgi:hypothetical protein
MIARLRSGRLPCGWFPAPYIAEVFKMAKSKNFLSTRADPPTDPIFDAIEKHRKASAEEERAEYLFETDPDLSDDCPSKPALDAASEVEYQAREELFATVPQTTEGWMALLR